MWGSRGRLECTYARCTGPRAAGRELRDRGHVHVLCDGVTVCQKACKREDIQALPTLYDSCSDYPLRDPNSEFKFIPIPRPAVRPALRNRPSLKCVQLCVKGLADSGDPRWHGEMCFIRVVCIHMKTSTRCVLVDLSPQGLPDARSERAMRCQLVSLDSTLAHAAKGSDGQTGCEHYRPGEALQI